MESLDDVEEEEDEDELDDDEDVWELTMILGLGLSIDIEESSGKEIEEMSAAVVSTGTIENWSSHSSKVAIAPIGMSKNSVSRLSLIWEIDDPMSKV